MTSSSPLLDICLPIYAIISKMLWLLSSVSLESLVLVEHSTEETLWSLTCEEVATTDFTPRLLILVLGLLVVKKIFYRTIHC